MLNKLPIYEATACMPLMGDLWDGGDSEAIGDLSAWRTKSGGSCHHQRFMNEWAEDLQNDVLKDAEEEARQGRRGKRQI